MKEMKANHVFTIMSVPVGGVPRRECLGGLGGASFLFTGASLFDLTGNSPKPRGILIERMRWILAVELLIRSFGWIHQTVKLSV